LVNGGRVVGRVVENNDKKVIVQVRWGTVEVRKEDIKLVIITGVDELEEELKKEEQKKEETKKEESPKEENPKEETPKKEETKPEQQVKPESKQEETEPKQEEEQPLTEEERKRLDNLIMQIGHPDAGIRRMGRLGLINFGRRAVPRLISALSDGNYWRRMNACDILREIGDSRALVPLLSRLKDENLYVRIAANNALVKLTGKRSLSYNPENPTDDGVTEWLSIVDELTKPKPEEGGK
jgi:chemotaxis protein histidine kinase CheA